MREQQVDTRSAFPCKKGAWPARTLLVGLAVLCRLHGLAAAMGTAAADAMVWAAILHTGNHYGWHLM